MGSGTRRVLRTGSVLVGVLALAGCSGSFSIGANPAKASEDLIEGDLADQLGFELTASCDKPESDEIGSTFNCTGTAEDGRVVEFVSERTAKDAVNLNTANVLVASDLEQLELASVQILEREVGLPLGVENFDCGRDAIVLDAGHEFVCALTDPTDGAVYDATLTLPDITDINSLSVEVAPAPRG
ncbi:MAG: hypothetical protein OEY23_13640 [Acidimicrobiia bacterium]|nr:hypothetical protein [Acidimicrobiia bacterium]